MRKRLKNAAGVTLVELMITVAILSLGVLAAVSSFQFITESIQNSKTRTLANNLAQEQIEKLKNLSYYMLLVTTSTYSDTRFSPTINYDTGNYAPQTLVEGGVSYLRATRVDLVYQNGSTLTTAAATDNDTGLKLLTVYVIWTSGGEAHYQEMHNLMANPAANPLNATFTGTVTNTQSGATIAGALVQVVDNTNWFGITDSAGVYRFNVSQGSYTLVCSTQGYFNKTTPSYLSITSGQVYTQNFALGRMGQGTASGYVYMNDHLVISQVVPTSATTTGESYEYVELYNPTTYQIFIGSNNVVNSPSVVPIFWDSGNNPTLRHLFYNTSYVPARGYYLITNTGNANPATACASLPLGGGNFTPDACWQKVPQPSHALPQDSAGGFSLGNIQSYTGNLLFVSSNWPNVGKIDSVAWSKNASGNSAPSNAREGSGISSTAALQPGEAVIRTTDPGTLNTTLGRAYDSNDNSHDFYDLPGYAIPPKTSGSGAFTPISGTPASGAYIAFTDTLSNLVTCNDTYTTAGICSILGAPGCRVCTFTSPGIATGTWKMVTSSGTYYQETNNVVITVSGSTTVPNGATSPTWPVVNTPVTLLNDTTNYAFITGVISGASGGLANITVSANGVNTLTGSTGRYFIATATGDVILQANYNNQNRAYTSQSSTLTTVAGMLYDNPSGASKTWFTLSLGGILVGYFQTGSATPLPGRVAVALTGGNVNSQAVSQSDGHFYLTNLTTGSYTIQPSLDPAESASPSSSTVILASTGSATSVSTFTITSGLSEITGQVLITASSQPITTGVLVVASTATLTGPNTTPPPAIQGADSILCDPCSYAGSSDSTGQYSIFVRSSALPYKVYGWYTTFNGQSPTVTRSGPYSVQVSTAGRIVTQNLSW